MAVKPLRVQALALRTWRGVGGYWDLAIFFRDRGGTIGNEPMALLRYTILMLYSYSICI